MNRTIQSVIEEMVVQLQQYGMSDATISTYKEGICRPILKYFAEKGCEIFSSDILDAYLAENMERLRNRAIGKDYFTVITRVVKILKSIGETGNADFSRVESPKKYCPTPAHMDLTEKIIAANSVSYGSVKELHADIRHFFCFIEAKRIMDSAVTDDTFYDFIHSVSESNAGSMQVIMRAVRCISAYWKENDISNLQVDFSKLPMKYAAVHLIPPYSQEEISKIVSAIDVSTDIGKRDYTIMLLAFDTGLRGSDIINLRCSDIDWRKCLLSIRQKKTKHPITQALNGNVMNALVDYILEGRPESDSKEVFLSSMPPHMPFSGSYTLDCIIEKYCKAANVKKKPKRSFYSVRRAFATELSLKGVALGEISELLGHRSTRSDKPYLSYNKEQFAFCASDFSGIPVTGGLYAKAFSEKSERGDDNGIS